MALWLFCTECFWVFLITVPVAVIFYLTYHFLFPPRYVDGLSNRYVLITGCDSGFGQQLAVRLDAKGVNVVAGCLTSEGIQKLEEKTSKKLKTVLMDVKKIGDVEKAFDFVQRLLPPSTGKYSRKTASFNIAEAIRLTCAFLP